MSLRRGIGQCGQPVVHLPQKFTWSRYNSPSCFLSRLRGGKKVKNPGALVIPLAQVVSWIIPSADGNNTRKKIKYENSMFIFDYHANILPKKNRTNLRLGVPFLSPRSSPTLVSLWLKTNQKKKKNHSPSGKNKLFILKSGASEWTNLPCENCVQVPPQRNPSPWVHGFQQWERRAILAITHRAVAQPGGVVFSARFLWEACWGKWHLWFTLQLPMPASESQTDVSWYTAA